MSLVNKKAKFDYEIIESFEAGVVLTGAEVKSVRDGAVNFAGARVVFADGKVKLLGMSINKYKYDSNPNYVADRVRELLLHKREVVEIGTKMKQLGLTLIPMRLYNKGSLVKMQVALVRGKKVFGGRWLN